MFKKKEEIINFQIAIHWLDQSSSDIKLHLSLIKWIKSCHKNRLTTRVIILPRVHLTSLKTSVSPMRFIIEIMFISKVIKSRFKWSFEKKSHSYEISKLAEGSFHKFHMKRSSTSFAKDRIEMYFHISCTPTHGI